MIDYEALEEIGLSGDSAIHPELAEKRSAPPDAVKPDAQDPFADSSTVAVSAPRENSAAETIDEHSHVASKASSATGKWWRQRHSEVANRQRASNAARLFYFLDRLDLTLNVRLGQLQITTQELAEQHCCMCIFDVTPLVDRREGRYQAGLEDFSQGSWRDFQSLMDVIQTTVDPDTWEALGGPSTISPYSTRDRRWLVVASPLVQLWEIEAVLTGLNE